MKSKLLKTTLAIAVVFLVAGYLYMAGNTKLNNEPFEVEKIAETTQENETTETETADWKTYKNEKHGLEFKYPDNLTIEDNLKPYGCIFIRKGAGLNVGWAYLELCAFYPDTYNSSVDFVKWIKDNSAEYDEAPDIYNFKIGGIDAVRVYHPKSPQTFSAYKINFLKDKRPYEIFLNDIDSKENTIIQNKIISTFKFKESLSVW